MNVLYIFLMVLHVLISASLIIVILAQSSKGGALDGMLGGAATNVLGGEGASKFLQKVTRILAVLFMVSSILSFLNLSVISLSHFSFKKFFLH